MKCQDCSKDTEKLVELRLMVCWEIRMPKCVLCDEKKKSQMPPCIWEPLEFVGEGIFCHSKNGFLLRPLKANPSGVQA